MALNTASREDTLDYHINESAATTNYGSATTLTLLADNGSNGKYAYMRWSLDYFKNAVYGDTVPWTAIIDTIRVGWQVSDIFQVGGDLEGLTVDIYQSARPLWNAYGTWNMWKDSTGATGDSAFTTAGGTSSCGTVLELNHANGTGCDMKEQYHASTSIASPGSVQWVVLSSHAEFYAFLHDSLDEYTLKLQPRSDFGLSDDDSCHIHSANDVGEVMRPTLVVIWYEPEAMYISTLGRCGRDQDGIFQNDR